MFFKEWLELLEVFGAGTYTVPKDKEQQLFDFYMLSFLQGLPQNNRGEEKVDYALKEVTQILLPTLKENLLAAVFFSLCAEFRHVFEMNSAKNLLEMAKKINDEYAKGFREYTKRLTLYKSKNALSIMRTPQSDHPDLDNQDANTSKEIDREASYHAVLKSGLSKQKFVYLMKIFYEKATWDSDYGGLAWAKICEAWMALNQAKNNGDMIVYIDHIYDLQHNTGTVFNKIKSYAKSGSYEWLKLALDLKANIKDPHVIIDKVSPKMRKLALQIIKAKTGKSYEEYLKDNEKTTQATNKVDRYLDSEENILGNTIEHKFKELDGTVDLKIARILLSANMFNQHKGKDMLPWEMLELLIKVTGWVDLTASRLVILNTLYRETSIQQQLTNAPILNYDFTSLKMAIDLNKIVKDNLIDLPFIADTTSHRIENLLEDGYWKAPIKLFQEKTNYSTVASRACALITFARLLLKPFTNKPDSSIGQTLEEKISQFDGSWELKVARFVLKNFSDEVKTIGASINYIVNREFGQKLNPQQIQAIGPYYYRENGLRQKYHTINIPPDPAPDEVKKLRIRLGPIQVDLNKDTISLVAKALNSNSLGDAVNTLSKATGWDSQACLNLSSHIKILNQKFYN